MSRCKACDVILEGKELSKTDAEDSHIDLCTNCYTAAIIAHWELDNLDEVRELVNITQDDILQLQDTYDNIYFSITTDY